VHDALPTDAVLQKLEGYDYFSEYLALPELQHSEFAEGD